MTEKDVLETKTGEWPTRWVRGKSTYLSGMGFIMSELGNMLVSPEAGQKLRVTIECDPEGQFTITREVFPEGDESDGT